MSRQVFTHPQESKTPSHRRGTGDNKYPLNISHFLLLLPVLVTEHDAMWFGIRLWSFGVTCPGCVPSQFLVQSQPPRWQGSTKSRKGLDALQAPLSNNKSIFILSKPFSSETQKTAPY